MDKKDLVLVERGLIESACYAMANQAPAPNTLAALRARGEKPAAQVGDTATLRDYFAAEAMQSLAADESCFELVAKLAYKLADAMIAERAK